MTTHATIDGVDASRSTALHPAGCRRAADDESEAVGDLLDRRHRAHLCDIYVAGLIGSQNFPTTANAFQRTYGGGPRAAFVVKFSSGRGDDDETADDYGWRRT